MNTTSKSTQTVEQVGLPWVEDTADKSDGDLSPAPRGKPRPHAHPHKISLPPAPKVQIDATFLRHVDDHK